MVSSTLAENASGFSYFDGHWTGCLNVHKRCAVTYHQSTTRGQGTVTEATTKPSHFSLSCVHSAATKGAGNNIAFMGAQHYLLEDSFSCLYLCQDTTVLHRVACVLQAGQLSLGSKGWICHPSKVLMAAQVFLSWWKGVKWILLKVWLGCLGRGAGERRGAGQGRASLQMILLRW